MSRSRLFPLLLSPIFFAGICDPGDITIVPSLEDSFSFEGGLEGWSVVASDLGSPPSIWSVETSSEQATTGASSLKLSLDNLGGQTRLLVKRPFDLDPATDYVIDLSFQLGTGDAGDVNAWNVIAGGGVLEPLNGSGLATVGSTANGQTTGTDLIWTEQSTQMSIRTGPDSGRIWLSVGIWATSPFARDFWIDDLSVVVRLP